MNSDLQHLVRLQQLDLDIESARRRIAQIPSVQTALDTRLAEGQAAVAAIKQRLAENQTRRRATEADVASLQTRLSKYKGQLMEVKTNKEYQAMQKEIATAEEAVRSLEDRILEQMEEAETLGRELKVTEAALKAQQDDITRERKRLEEEAGALQQRTSETTSTRAALAKELSPAALRLFEHVSRQRKGLAVAQARDGICTVCHVRLRPQVFNEVRRNESLIQCESCLRILYYSPTTAPNMDPPQAS
jgi:predicted  nucleic acid-binding Zn-ribbon protein